jgi:hypothetical protein
MFEDIIKQKPHLANVLHEAMNALKDVAEPHKTKIMNGFKALDRVSFSMHGYKEADTMMDDSASELTAMTGIDVRKEGVCEALKKVMKYGDRDDKAKAIELVIKWHIADYLKLKAEDNA